MTSISIATRLFHLFLVLMVFAAGAAKRGVCHGAHSPPIGLDAPEVILLLEQRYGVSIFYRAEWFAGRPVAPYVADLPLAEALQRLAQGHITILHLGGMIFLLPLEDAGSAVAGLYGDEVTIGSPAAYGRYSRATLSGLITDGETDEPLVGAVLYESGTGAGAMTDMEGRYVMVLPVGDRELRVSYIGYEDRFQRVRLIASGQLDMGLYTSSTRLDEVTVLARRAEENVTRTQMSMIKLDARAIRELPGSYGEPDIIRTVALLPGVQAVGEFGTGFNVRGGGADQNLILMEHVPIFNTSHLFGLVSVVNPDLVSSVTLIKAGTPARHGERVSSVMDIRLGEGLNIARTAVKGSLGMLSSRLMLEAPLVKDKATLALGARSSHSDLFLRQMPSEDLMNSTAGFYDLTALGSLAINGSNTLALFGYHSADRFGFAEDTHYAYANTLASLRWSSVFGRRLTSAFVLGWSRYLLEVKDRPALNPGIHSMMTTGIGYRSAKWNLVYLPADNHHVEFGLGAVAYGVEPGEMLPLGDHSAVPHKKIDRQQGLELSAYVSDDISLGEQLSLELGLRFTQYLQAGPGMSYRYGAGRPRTEESLADSVFYGNGEVMASYQGLEPRLGLRWRAGTSNAVKLSYARIHQYINLLSNTSIAGPTDVWKLSDDHLKPLRSDQYAVGYFQNFSDNTVELSAELYYRKLRNAIDYMSGAEIAMNPRLETGVVNIDGYGYGLELYLRKAAGRASGWASYTFSRSQRRSRSPFPESQINGNRHFPSNFDRPHNLVLNMNYRLSRRWRLGAVFTYHSGRPVTLPELVYHHGRDVVLHFSDRNKYRLPDYHRLDLSVSLDENLRLRSRGKGSFTFSVVNAYGRKNPHAVFFRREPDSYFTARNYKLYQLYIIARPLPALSYTFSF